MKKTSLSILFLFLFMQILNFKVYGDMHDMPMDMPSVDQKAYTKKISVPDTPQKVKDATLIILAKGKILNIKGITNSKFLLISGKPIGEPIARGGPFVMNTKEEILKAVQDYHNGTFVK